MPTFNPQIWQPTDNGRGYVRQPNLNLLLSRGEEDIYLYTYEECHRISNTSMNAQLLDAKRVLVLGDSFPTALFVNYEDSFIGLLEQ